MADIIETSGSCRDTSTGIVTVCQTTGQIIPGETTNGTGVGLVTAFGERLALPLRPAFQHSFDYNVNEDIFTVTLVGTGTTGHADGKGYVDSGVDVNATATIESKRPLTYLPGTGGNIRFTAIFDTPQTGSVQEIGYGDEEDGLFFGYDGTTFGVLRRNDSVDNWTTQANWNTDTMDGSGPSGVTLDHTMGNVYMIQFQWLGFGPIDFFIETAPKMWQLVHRIDYLNQNTVPTILAPSLPFCMFVDNGSSNETPIRMECSSVGAFTESFEDPPLFTRSQEGNQTGTTLSGDDNPVVSIRNKVDYQSRTNRTPVLPEVAIVQNSTSTKTIGIKLNINGSPATANWADVSTNTSPVEWDDESTSVTGGTTVFLGYIARGGFAEFDFTVYAELLLGGDTITILADMPSGGNGIVIANIIWGELL